MPTLSNNDINDAKRRVEEMRKRSQAYVDTPHSEQINGNIHNKEKSSNFGGDLNFLSDIAGSLFSSSNNDSSVGIILALILILSREGADSKLILALLYILL